MEQHKENFDERNVEKKRLHFWEESEFFVRPREIWYIKMWINVWFEENWKREFKRPILVLKKVGALFFTVALTSKGKDDNKFYHKLATTQFNERNLKYKESSYIILSQVKVVDKKRFTEIMWSVGNEEFLSIKEKLKEFLL
jgi:hypothetical protein